MKHTVALPPAVGLIAMLMLAVGCVIGFLRATDIAEYNAKMNRKVGLEFLARANEELANILVMKIIFTFGFMMACYGAYSIVSDLL